MSRTRKRRDRSQPPRKLPREATVYALTAFAHRGSRHYTITLRRRKDQHFARVSDGEHVLDVPFNAHEPRGAFSTGLVKRAIREHDKFRAAYDEAARRPQGAAT